VGDADRGVEIDPQLTTGRGRPGLPRARSGGGPRRPHPGQMRLIDPIQQPPRRRHRRHRAEQGLPVAQHPDPAHCIRPISDRHRQVGKHLPRQVHWGSPVGVQQRTTHRIRQPRLNGQFPKQRWLMP
jgi:hypothetical protein